jgi:lipoprotein-anchoring transpeptidase ErfK/SrfK
MKKVLFILVSATFCLFASKVIPISVTEFDVVSDEHTKHVDLRGREFIVVSVRERGSDGRFYAVDRDGVVWWSGAITSGADDFKTPSGIYSVKYKKRYHMSSAYPSNDGVNNMDYSIFFTNQGHALHQGSTDWMSHGCIHIDPKEIQTIYRWAHSGTKIIITRESYMPFARKDLLKYNIR